MADGPYDIYPYRPSHAAAIVLSIVIAASLSLHIYQGLLEVCMHLLHLLY